ncbi:polysaccharide biosynthesis protein [Alkalilimnicola sp. S0819]|uniref:polysaccharide biosynthesis protein n=1 Tax=Alkalilimnicola sp. S0819 TaxID=2613922 RepID=UPI00128D1003|nr:nucleoside-diphosphate sugar epimerase/dehydratase [Alkalilimnicola sp. S0819]
MLPLMLWGAFALRFGELMPPSMARFWWLFPVAPLVAIPMLKWAGLYRAVLRYMGPNAAIAVLKGVSLSAVLLAALALMGNVRDLPRTIPILYWLLAMLYVGGSRFLLRAMLQRLVRRPRLKEPMIIYGAGSAGAQLAAALSHGPEFHPVAFVDDDSALWGSVVRGVSVYAPTEIERLVERYEARQLLLAIPSASRQRRREILMRLEPLSVHVKTIPGFADIVSGRARADEVREVPIEDLLGRDPVAPDTALLDRCIRDKVVLVSGAGGSIGAELCRQIVQRRPRALLLYDVSEYGLYQIEHELRRLKVVVESELSLIPLLGSVVDQARLEQVLRQFSVQTVYHAAAYKHVPIVEHNILEGIRNNVFGTLAAARAAQAAAVESFVLVSTDKAVRPTNVMGASKRLAELVLQALAREEGVTRFTMVRFGNVLGSSGSVVPLFRRQIARGGPLTVTHPQITRYFMTIPEAAALVIQAGSMGQGGDVFVLEMGEPVRIVDMARKMVRLTGLQVRDEDNPEGDIAIEFTGLRPGEKLYEELLIGDNVTETGHEMIMRAEEACLPWDTVQGLLNELRQACLMFDGARARAVLQQAVPEYAPQGDVREYLQPLPGSAAGAKAHWLEEPGSRA